MPRYVLGYGRLCSASWVSNEALCVITRAGAFRFDPGAGTMAPILEGVYPQHAAVSPDGARLAYGDGDGVVVTGTDGATLFRAPVGQACALAFSPDGKALLVARQIADATEAPLRSLDAATGEELSRFGLKGRFAETAASHYKPELLAMSPDGEWVASFGSGDVHLWLADGTPVTKWYASRVKGLAFAEGGGRLLVAGGNASVGDDYLYLAERGGERVRAFAATGPLWQWLALAVAPGGARFAAASETDGVHVFGLGGERELHLTADALLRDLTGRRGLYVTSLAFSPDESRLAVCTGTPYSSEAGRRPMSVQVFDVKGGERLALARDFANEPRDLTARGDRLFLAVDGDAKETSMALGRPRTLVPGRHDVTSSKAVHSLAVDPKGGRAVAAFYSFNGDDLVAHDVATGAHLRDFAGPTGGSPPAAIAVSPDGGLVAAAYGMALVWRFDRKTPLAKLGTRRKNKPSYGESASSLAFSPDGGLLGVTTRDGTARLYAAPKFSLARELEAKPSPRCLQSFAFSPDGRLAFAGDVDGAVYAWHVDSGAQAFCLAPAEAGAAALKSVDRLALSDDGRLLAAGTRDGRLSIIDPARGERLSAWRAHGGGVTGLAFSTYEASLFSSGEDGAVLQWPVAFTPG